MTWTYDYRDRPRPSYRIQDGSDDGDVAECWDEDVAQAIVAVMNSVERSTTAIVAPEPAKETDRKWGVWLHDSAPGWMLTAASEAEPDDERPWSGTEMEARVAVNRHNGHGAYRAEARPLPETEET